MWRVVASLAPLLSDKFRDANEDLAKVLTGSKRSEDLWKRCMGETDGAVGMALGSLFIEKAFEGSSKQQVRGKRVRARSQGRFNMRTRMQVEDDACIKRTHP